MSILADQLERMISEATARGHARTGAISQRQRSGQYAGPREDAEPSNELPRLRYGFDRLPTRCGHCGGRSLEIEPPGTHAETGRVVCWMCSRQSAWISS